MFDREEMQRLVRELDERDWNYSDDSVPLVDVRRNRCYPGLMVPIDDGIFLATVAEKGFPYRSGNTLGIGQHFLSALATTSSHRSYVRNNNGQRDIVIEPTGTLVEVEKPVGYRVVSVLDDPTIKFLEINPEEFRYPTDDILNKLYLHRLSTSLDR